MGLYEEAVKQYESAIAMRPNSSLCSNLGLAYYRLGDEESAEEAYQQAIRIDPRNAYAHNNYATLLFHQGEYEESLRSAEEAVAINATFKQALSTAALCCALIQDKEGYQNYYRRAVANGYDGQKIKGVLTLMGVEL